MFISRTFHIESHINTWPHRDPSCSLSVPLPACASKDLNNGSFCLKGALEPTTTESSSQSHEHRRRSARVQRSLRCSSEDLNFQKGVKHDETTRGRSLLVLFEPQTKDIQVNVKESEKQKIFTFRKLGYDVARRTTAITVNVPRKVGTSVSCCSCVAKEKQGFGVYYINYEY